ncbi:fibronectin type III domain-containing protein, partial [Amycolatopsis sp. H20-H5]|uniref:fibronectin type III domain-containing protein n=1 Tax=Amycolatopsis sp. H20-H5 TaxID=3046309 RepID=UPI002DBCECE1
GNGSATVRWGAATDNRAPITSYRVSWQGGSTTVGGGARSADVTGLTNGVRYTFTVVAVNKAGTGPGASAAPVTPAGTASAPTGLTAKAQNGGATLSWGAPDLGGGTLQYYTVSASGQADKTVTGTSTTFTGLSAGKSVTFTVRAVTKTSDGQSRTGAAASKTLTVPAPKITIGRGGDAQTDHCKAPDCSWIVATFRGFAPNTKYTYTPYSGHGRKFSNSVSFTTDANGSAREGTTDYDVPDQTVYFVVTTTDGQLRSNDLYWEKR